MALVITHQLPTTHQPPARAARWLPLALLLATWAHNQNLALELNELLVEF
jgi:hypothetical protein